MRRALLFFGFIGVSFGIGCFDPGTLVIDEVEYAVSYQSGYINSVRAPQSMPAVPFRSRVDIWKAIDTNTAEGAALGAGFTTPFLHVIFELVPGYFEPDEDHLIDGCTSRARAAICDGFPCMEKDVDLGALRGGFSLSAREYSCNGQTTPALYVSSLALANETTSFTGGDGDIFLVALTAGFRDECNELVELR